MNTNTQKATPITIWVAVLSLVLLFTAMVVNATVDPSPYDTPVVSVSRNVTDPFNAKFHEQIWEGVLSTASPTAFSINVGEGTETFGNWDTFIVQYEEGSNLSAFTTVGSELVTCSNVFYSDMDGDNIKEVLTTTMTDGIAGGGWIVTGRNYPGIDVMPIG